MIPPIQATNTIIWRAFCRHMWFEFIVGSLWLYAPRGFPRPTFPNSNLNWNVLVWFFLIFHYQARTRTGFQRFTEIGQIFHNKYIFNKKNFPGWNLENGLDKCFIRGEFNWSISHLNDSETQERGLEGVKIPKSSWGSMPQDPPRSFGACLGNR